MQRWPELSISGKIWPVHFPPFPDEALTSWFSRLALYHFQVPSTFFMYSIPHRGDSWKQDLDVFCSEVILRQLSEKCSQPYDTLFRHTLNHWRNRFDPYDGASTALPRWVTPALIRRYTAHHHGCKVCILCLRRAPYLKLNTRFLFHIACPVHNVLMTEKCNRCDCAISSHRVFPPLIQAGQMDALSFCHHCGNDFRLGTPKSASEDEMNLVRFCLDTIDKGHCRLGQLTLQYSHLFFEGFRLVCRSLLRPRQREFMKHHAPGFDTAAVNHLRKYEIEFLPLEEARQVLVIAMWLLGEWPDRFLKVNREYSLLYSDWIFPRDVVPYWFGSVAKEYLRKANITTKRRPFTLQPLNHHGRS